MHSKKSGLVGTLREQATLCERTTHKIRATEFSYWKASTFPVLTESERNYGISINCCCCCFVAMMAVSHPKGNQSKSLPFLVYVVLQSINCNSHLLGSDFASGAPYNDWKLYENYYLSFSFLFFVDDKVPLKEMVCQKQLEKQCTMSSIGNLQKISGDWVSLFWNYLPEWDTSSDLNIKDYIYIFISHTLSSPRPCTNPD